MNISFFVYCTRFQAVLTETELPVLYSVTWYEDFTNRPFKNSCNFIYVREKIMAFQKRSYPKLTNYTRNYVHISITTFTEIGR
jgi:hypothetical protein